MGISRLDEFAARHHGLVTRRAAVKAGLSERAWYRAIEAGQLERIHPGVCRMYGASSTAVQRIHAAVLAAGKGALASHRSAARLWGLPRPEDEPVDLILPQRTHRALVVGATVHRPRDLLDLNPSRKDGIRTTNNLRTLCDLGAVDAAA